MKIPFHDKKSTYLALFKAANKKCKESLNKHRRSWLDNAPACDTYEGDSLSVMSNGTFSQVESIFYADSESAADVASQLGRAMRSWVVSNANHGMQGVAFVLIGSGEKVSLHVSVPGYGGKAALEAAFPGIIFGNSSQLVSLTEKMTHGGVITGVPAYGENDSFPLYSLDSFIRGMRGKKFTLFIAANPIPTPQLTKLRENIEKEIGDNHDAIKNEISNTLGESTANTLGVSGNAFGSITKALTYGVMASSGVMVAPGGVGFMASLGGQLARTVANTIGGSGGVNASLTSTRSHSISNSSESLNRFAEAYEEALKECEARMKKAESEGGWETVACLFADNYADYKFGASLFKTGLTAEYDTYEPFRIVDIPGKENSFSLFTRNIRKSKGGEGSFSTILTSSELASLMSLPTESHPGIEIRSTPRFSVAHHQAADSFVLGRICDREVLLPNEFYVSRQDLQAHTLVTGLTGMGKSTTVRSILTQAAVPFLVLEPAKCEYRNLSINNTPIQVITAGDDSTAPLRLNPFELERGETLHSHMDALSAILNASFPMEGPMAAILEQGIARAYSDMGWDVEQGVAPLSGAVPTMDSFYESLRRTLNEQGLCGDYGSNIQGALLARINSLRVGARGSMFNTQKRCDMANLLSAPTVIEMKHIGNDETKAFLCGVLLHRIYKYMEHRGESATLTNLLVVEEAHRLFRRAQQNTGSIVGNNTAYQSVTIFENILSEVRAYGLGIIIAEQLPLRLSDGAIKNTNLKIVHRLSAREDAETMGGSMGLSPEHSSHICRIRIGEALVHSARISKPAHIRLSMPSQYKAATRDDHSIKALRSIGSLSEMRPEHFASYRHHIQLRFRKEVENLADRCWFTLLMSSARNGKWQSIWTAAWTEMAELMQRAEVFDAGKVMVSHLLHDAVLQNLKEKQYIKKQNVLLHEEICELWDNALDSNLNLNESVIRKLRNLYTDNKISHINSLPNWLLDKSIQNNIYRYYQEAKQTAAAIRLMHPEIISSIHSCNHQDTVNTIAAVLVDRCIKGIDNKNGLVAIYAMAVVIALINIHKQKECIAAENLRALDAQFEKYYGCHD